VILVKQRNDCINLKMPGGWRGNTVLRVEKNSLIMNVQVRLCGTNKMFIFSCS